MPLTSPIPLVLTDDPAAKYQEIAATIPDGGKYVQEFDHLCVENLDVTESKYLEDMYPNATILGADGKLDSWDGKQSALGACGSFAQINAYGSVPDGCQYKAEDAIYPLEPSRIGLYFVRIQSPLDPLKTTWMAIDSRVATKPGVNKSAFFNVTDSLAPGLLLKARATAMGGAWNEITNHPSFSQKMNWFPCATVTCKTFDELKTAISSGGLYVFSLTQQYDDLGQKITPSGVVYGHAYSIADCISVMHNGQEMQLIRIQNPWGGGSEWVSTVSEGSQFWVDHPELAQKEADAKSSGGNYWIEREQFETLTGRTTFDVTMPLPLSTHIHTKIPLVYAFDETTAITPPWTAQLCALATRKNDLTTVQVTAPTNLLFVARWMDGSGARNHQIKFANMSNTFVVQTDVTNSAGLGTKSVTLQPGTYKMLPCTQNMMVDRGNLEITIMSDRDVVLSRNGAIA